MQDRPNQVELLEAIQEFLLKELLPEVKEQELISYKTLVSWNMLGVLVRELKSGDKILTEEIADFSQYFKESFVQVDSSQQKQELCRQLNQKLCHNIREQGLNHTDQTTWELVKKNLQRKLSITNPRF